MRFVILAAGKSRRIYKKINKIKCLVSINKKSLISTAIEELKKASINSKITIVTGFQSSQIKKELRNYKNLNYLYNNQYHRREMLHSFYLALKKYNTDMLFCYSDIIFSNKTIKSVLKNKKKSIVSPVNTNWQKIWKIRKKNPYKDAEHIEINKKNELLSIGKKIKNIKKTKYQYMGLVYIPINLRKKILKNYKDIENNKKTHLTTFLNLLIKKNIKIKCVKSKENWYEFDDYQDLKNYKKYYNFND